MEAACSAGSKQYVYLSTAAVPIPVAMLAGDTRYAIVADHLNTPRRLTQPDGNLRWQWTYSAFGEEQPTVAERKFNKVAPVQGDFEFNLRYPGQYADAESGLNYNYFRSYSAVTGRYTQPDPIGLSGGWNRAVYVDSNPLKFSDPLGLNPFAGAAAGAAAGSAFGPIGTAVGGAIGAGAGAWIGWNVIGPMLSESLPRGLPPAGLRRPIPEADECKPGPASRPSERDKGGQSLWDPNGGEWRWFGGDRWHNPHWDHNPHDGKSSLWVKIPHGGLPPVKK